MTKKKKQKENKKRKIKPCGRKSAEEIRRKKLTKTKQNRKEGILLNKQSDCCFTSEGIGKESDLCFARSID